ncbi:hypothetical protein O3G_MSEX001989 [Manduca sexta]|uniref:FLYWCH-type domain-containing protein n=1 Tax=Manduca sexta TaxID=7130 RepID=A0A922CDF4_MANSE|nr:hypothetical protein O3G_MSEX001989 [Manduca sexta]
MLFLDGYTFTQANDTRWRAKTLKRRWTCSTRARYGCKAKVFTVDKWIVQRFNEHNHPKPKRPEY